MNDKQLIDDARSAIELYAQWEISHPAHANSPLARFVLRGAYNSVDDILRKIGDGTFDIKEACK